MKLWDLTKYIANNSFSIYIDCILLLANDGQQFRIDFEILKDVYFFWRINMTNYICRLIFDNNNPFQYQIWCPIDSCISCTRIFS